MQLYLMRHGHAKSGEVDPERHLRERGRREVEKIAEFIGPFKLQVDAIWHSDKARAIETAAIVSEAVNARNGLIERQGLAPLDPVAPIVAEVEAMDAGLMIVGHLPFMPELAGLLLTGRTDTDLFDLPCAGIICMLRDEDDGLWRVRWFLSPDMIP